MKITRTPNLSLRGTDNFSEMQDYAGTWAKQILDLHSLTDQKTEEIVSEVMERVDGKPSALVHISLELLKLTSLGYTPLLLLGL